MLDLNEFYREFSASPEQTRFMLVKKAISDLVRVINDLDSASILYYEGEDAIEFKQNEFRTLDWPYFNDGGIFDQAYDMALRATKIMIPFIRG